MLMWKKPDAAIALMAALLFGGHARAGTVGNGGDVVYCEVDGEPSVELLDYYEGRVIRGLTIPQRNADTLEEATTELLNRLIEIDPLNGPELRTEVDEFMQKAVFIPGIVLNDIPDSEHIYIPRGCSLRQIAIQMVPKLPGDHEFTVSKDLWDLLSYADRAGLALHEVIYKRARVTQENSILTRYLNAFFASTELVTSSDRGYHDMLHLTKILRSYGKRFEVQGHEPIVLKLRVIDDMGNHTDWYDEDGAWIKIGGSVISPASLHLAQNRFDVRSDMTLELTRLDATLPFHANSLDVLINVGNLMGPIRIGLASLTLGVRPSDGSPLGSGRFFFYFTPENRIASVFTPANTSPFEFIRYTKGAQERCFSTEEAILGKRYNRVSFNRTGNITAVEGPETNYPYRCMVAP